MCLPVARRTGTIDAMPAAHVTNSDAEFLQAFEACTLPAGRWTHEAHVRMAWLCLGQASYPEAVARIRAGIRRYNEKVLDKLPEYHETVTLAFARLIAARSRPQESWKTFIARNVDLLARDPPALGFYYSRSLLMSESARRQFVEPDLQPLPVVKGVTGAEEGATDDH